jgi:hypothetical protein
MAKVVWAFKAKGKEMVDKKNVQLDPSRKSQERRPSKEWKEEFYKW